MRAAFAFVLVFLAGCAAFAPSESDCRVASWRERGYADGYGGHPPQDLRLAQGCGRFGVQVARGEYLEGWRDGYDEWYRLIGSIDVN
jgi:hypothetical protein